MAYNYHEELPEEAKGRYQHKLDALGLSECPYKLAGDTWLNNPKDWPKFQYPDLYHYLINEPRVYSREAMKNFKSLEAYRFFISGWVQTVYHQKLPTGDFLFKADVRPSYRVNDDPHHPWLALAPSGAVLTGHCDCKAGLGETCSHVAGTLFKIEAAVRLGFTSSACTDEPCRWNSTFCEDVKAVPLSDINFYKDKTKDKQPIRKRKAGAEDASAEDQELFLDMLSSTNKNVVGLSLFSSHSHKFVSTNPVPPTSIHNLTYPDSLRCLYKPEYEDMGVDDLKQVTIDQIQLSSNTIERIEEATRRQSSCTTWFDVREGRITASVAHDCLHTNQESPAQSLMKKLCLKSSFQHSASNSTSNKDRILSAREWGTVHEHDGYLVYEQHMTGKAMDPSATVPRGKLLGTHRGVHEDCVISKSGFIIDKTSQFLGVSPDGIVHCKCCGKGGIEIKCPFSCKDTPLEDKISTKGFYIDSSLQLDKKHRYYTQMQLQMCVLQVDYVVWTPLDYLILRVERDDAFIEPMIAKLKLMWENHVLPELLSRKLERQIERESQEQAPAASTSQSTNPDEQKVVEYCICKATTDLDNMIGCDSCNNWFHLTCLKLKRFPKVKVWYCKMCRKNKNKRQQKK